MELENNALFWQKIDTLYLSSDTVITKKKGESHNTYANLIYPVDYGYLKEMSEEENTLPIYVGTEIGGGVNSIIVCADILKKDLDVKLLVNCSNEEEKLILQFLNQTDFQKSVVIRRGNDIPDWAATSN